MLEINHTCWPTVRKYATRLHCLLTKRSGQNSRGFVSVMAPFLPLLTEQVSTPEIKVLNLTQENGNCSLMLACEAEKGDHVTYSWSKEAGTHRLIIANGSHLLYLTLGPQHADSTYICTASNPISNHSQIIIPWPRCRTYPPGEWWLVCHINNLGSVPTWTNCSASITMVFTLIMTLYPQFTVEETRNDGGRPRAQVSKLWSFFFSPDLCQSTGMAG